MQQDPLELGRADCLSAAGDLFGMLIHRPAWMADAVCREHPELDFFPPRGAFGASKAVHNLCASCLVRPECLEFALAHEEPAGVWGGLSTPQRRALHASAA